jgi:ketosteroid isomerase-like protein
MSVESARLVQSLYLAAGRGDVPFILSKLSGNVRWTQPGAGLLPWGGRWDGRNKVAEFFEILASEVEYKLFEPLEFVAEGEYVVVRGSSTAVVHRSQQNVTQSWVMIWTVRGGTVTTFEYFDDTAKWEAALSWSAPSRSQSPAGTAAVPEGRGSGRR